MNKITQNLKLLVLLAGMFIGTNLHAQIGIGTTAPAGGSILDINSADKGILVPRVNITNLGNIAPVTGGATVGLLVWNTNAGTGVGYHYWDGTAWVPLLGATPVNNSWDLAGNATVAANFFGTTNNQSINIRTNNIERMRVQNNGQVTIGFGAGNANAGDQFSAVALTNGGIGVAGYSGSTSFGVYGQNIGGGVAVYGINNSSGDAVRGYSLGALASGDAVVALHDGSGDAVYADHVGSGDGVHSIAYGTGVGVYAENYYFTDASIHAVDGLFSVYADNNFGYDALRADTDDAISNAVWATNPNVNGTAIIGGVGNLSVYIDSGSGVAGSGRSTGVYGYAGSGTAIVANRGNAGGRFVLDTDNNPGTNELNNGIRASAVLAGFDNVSPDGTLTSLNSYFGGYFVGGNHNNGTPSYAFAGIKYNANVNGINGTNYKIIGNGTNSTIIRDKNDTPRILFSPEAPEILFEDYGTGTLANGIAHIAIDPILKDAIYVDEKHPLKVFIQLEGDCNGVFVTNKSASGFTVKELGNGTSNVAFSWHLVANRADDIDANGEIASKHVGLRLPVGPEPMKQKELSQRKEGDNLGKDTSSKKAPKKKSKREMLQQKADAEQLSPEALTEASKKIGK